jgi:hypothetical protein
MTYKEAIGQLRPEERTARIVSLYYEDQGWYPCVPILETTIARCVPHPSCSSFRVMRVVEKGKAEHVYILV